MDKKFDKNLHEQYDKFGKDKVIELFEKNYKIKLVENEAIVVFIVTLSLSFSVKAKVIEF